MINEGEGGGIEGSEALGGLAGLGGGEAGGEGMDQPGVIHVSPQDKEAIERVSFFFKETVFLNLRSNAASPD